MFETFKKAWGKKRTNDYERRKGKVEAALKEVEKAAAPLQALGRNGNQGAQLAYNSAVSSCKALQDRLVQADELADSQPGDAYKLLEDIKKQARLAAEAAETAREEKVYKDPSSRVELNMGDGWEGPAPKIHPAAIKGFDTLDAVEIEKATEVIGDKIKSGKRLLDDLLLNPEAYLDKDPELKDIADLMWYLRTKAEELVGEPFEKGALSLPDSGKLLRGYLDRCEEVYNRFSSHLKDQQKKVGGSARGIDFYEGDINENPDALLPYGMNTLLVQSMTIDATGEERVYIKLETEGSRRGTGGAKGFIQHGFDSEAQLLPTREGLDLASLPQNRPEVPEDVGRARHHAMNFLFKQKSRIKGLGRFTENEIDGDKDAVKDELVPRYQAVIDAAKKLKLATDALKQGNYKKEFHVMVSNIEAFTSALENDALGDEKKVKPLADALDAFADFAISKGMDKNAGSRAMTEAVLTTEFLKPKGVTADSVASDLEAELLRLKNRPADEHRVARLEALMNGPRLSLQRAANFMTVPQVKRVVAQLQAEIDLIAKQVSANKDNVVALAPQLFDTHFRELRVMSVRGELPTADPEFPSVEEAEVVCRAAMEFAREVADSKLRFPEDDRQTALDGAIELMNEVDLLRRHSAIYG